MDLLHQRVSRTEALETELAADPGKVVVAGSNHGERDAPLPGPRTITRHDRASLAAALHACLPKRRPARSIRMLQQGPARGHRSPERRPASLGCAGEAGAPQHLHCQFGARQEHRRLSLGRPVPGLRARSICRYGCSLGPSPAPSAVCSIAGPSSALRARGLVPVRRRSRFNPITWGLPSIPPSDTRGVLTSPQRDPPLKRGLLRANQAVPSPASLTATIACARSATWTLLNMLEMWLRSVCGLSTRHEAICPLLYRCAISLRTFRSRSVCKNRFQRGRRGRKGRDNSDTGAADRAPPKRCVKPRTNESGERPGSRTPNTRIKSPLLCQLS